MSGTTISGTYLTGITLSNAATQNPATITADATLSGGLVGASGSYWTISNSGAIDNDSAGMIAVKLSGGGDLTNNASATIAGSLYGVYSNGGSVTNAAGALITGNQIGVEFVGLAGSVINSGMVGYQSHTFPDLSIKDNIGVLLFEGGYVTNANSGVIVGQTAGIEASYGPLEAINDGIISLSSDTSAAAAGVVAHYANITNNGVISVDVQSSAPGSFRGFDSTSTGVDIKTGQLANTGTIRAGGIAASFGSHTAYYSAYLYNSAGGLIQGLGVFHDTKSGIGVVASNSLYMSMVNAGTIAGKAAAIELSNGGNVTNLSSGFIEGSHFGIEVEGPGIVLDNFGSIKSTDRTVTGYLYRDGTGVRADAGGSIINEASASITGVEYGIKLGGQSTVVNSGTIRSDASIYGARTLANNGAVLVSESQLTNTAITNTALGLIEGDGFGISASGGIQLQNAGTVTSTSTHGFGVRVTGGTLTNAAGGAITGSDFGVYIGGNTTSRLVNSGSIAGSDITSGIGVSMYGALSNLAAGVIEGGVIGISFRGGTITNAGTIIGHGGQAVFFDDFAQGRVIVDPGAVFDGDVVGGISASDTLELASGSSIGTISGLGTAFVNFGSVLVDSRAHWELTGSNSLASGSTLTNSGTLALFGATFSDAGGIVNNGKIELDPSTMNVASLSGTGTVSIDAGSTLAVQGVVSAGQDIVFTGSGGELDLATPSAFAGTLTGFADGDIIDLTSVADVAGSSADMDYATNLLTVTENGTAYQFQFDKTETFAGDFFHLVSKNGGTVIEENQIACYRRGTLIATGHGEVPVEALAIGDEVMTASGARRPIKWIGRRSYGGRFIVGRKDILPICFKAGSIDDGVPRRDLWISPHHAMYFYVDVFGGLLIEARDLLNGTSIVQIDQAEQIDYFHIELDSHDVILAEGALSETFVDDDSRGMFHNADEHALLYPEKADEATRYCAPRVGDGFGLETVRQRLAHRAGLISTTPQSGRLRGYVDLISACSIEGWAQNPDHPEAPVCLDICADGRLIGQTLANRYREDLEKAGLGSGRHAFVFQPPAVTLPSTGAIEVRRSFDGAVLGRSAAPKSASKSALVA